MLNFKKFAILTADEVKMIDLRKRAKFRGDQSSYYQDIAIFWYTRRWLSDILLS